MTIRCRSNPTEGPDQGRISEKIMIYQFAGFTIDTERFLLRQGGASVSIEPLAFDLLLYLAENRDRVVGRDELLENLWRGKVVSDSALAARLRDVRKAVGDSGSRQQVIRTVHGRGYQFVAQLLTGGDSSATEQPGPVEHSIDLSIPEHPSIAVLPFTVMSADPEQEFFADGVAEDIITALSKISRLLVVARNSTFTYKGKPVDVKQVSREQGVRYVLQGSVRKAGHRVRVTVQLVDALTGGHRWAERYDRELEDIFAVQDDITRNVVSALDVHLWEGEEARIWSSGTESVEAWEQVRSGMDLINAMPEDHISKALRLGQRAIELDPGYAAAWVLQAWAHCHASDDTTRPAEERERALDSMRDCAQHALECDPSCAEAYSALGLCELSAGNHAAAVLNADKSVELAPSHATIVAVSGNILNKCGQPERAIKRIRKAMRLSPVYPAWFLHILGQSSRLLGRSDAAIAAYRTLVDRQPDALIGHIYLAAILGQTRRMEEASVSADGVLRIDPDFSIKTYTKSLSYSDPAEVARIEEGLRNAGLPE